MIVKLDWMVQKLLGFLLYCSVQKDGAMKQLDKDV